MVKITCFQINLSKSPAVYRPQETVSGNIEIEVKEDLAFNSLSISINAFGYTYWYFFIINFQIFFSIIYYS